MLLMMTINDNNDNNHNDNDEIVMGNLLYITKGKKNEMLENRKGNQAKEASTVHD